VFDGFAPPGFTSVSDAQVETFLRARFGGPVRGIERFGAGDWSQAYGFERDGEGYVARFSALEEDFAKDRIAARYRSPGLPIPPLIEIGEAFGGFYALSERAYGRYLEETSAARMRALLPSLFGALDAARHVDLSALSGYGLWDAGSTAAHATWQEALLDVANDRPTARIHGWKERLAAAPIGPGPFEEGYGHLQALVAACPEDRHLIHSDLLHANVLVEGARITAVLDWGSSLYGDFLYDIAWFCFFAPWFPAWQEINFAREAARHYEAIGLAVPNFEQRLRCYQVHIGLDAQAYNAFRGSWAELALCARRTLAVATPRP